MFHLSRMLLGKLRMCAGCVARYTALVDGKGKPVKKRKGKRKAGEQGPELDFM